MKRFIPKVICFFCWGLCSGLGIAGSQLLGVAAIKVSPAGDLQARTQQEDENAAAAFQQGIHQVESLIAMKKGTSEEVRLKLGLTEDLFELARVQFRLANGVGSKEYQEQRRKEYLSTLKHTQTLAYQLIQSKSVPDKVPRLYYLMAVALKESRNNSLAFAYFKYLLDHFPSCEDRVAAHFQFHAILEEMKDYHTALVYLLKLRPDPSEKFYPLYLDKVAWAYYFLGDIPNAHRYLVTELALIQSAAAAQPGKNIEASKIFKNWALFYFMGLIHGYSPYPASAFVESLKKLSPGPDYLPTLKYFSNLLRSKGRYDDFEALKHQVMHDTIGRGEILEFLLTELDAEVDRRQFRLGLETVQFLREIVSQGMPKTSSTGSLELPKAEGDLANVREKLRGFTKALQAVYSSNKSSKDSEIIGDLLIHLYDLLGRINEDSLEKQKSYFNIAEVYLGKKSFGKATEYYLKVAQMGQASQADPAGALAKKAKDNAIYTRYAELVEKKMIPKALIPVRLEDSGGHPLPPLAAEWVDWVKGSKDTPVNLAAETAGFYFFERCRLLYYHHHVPEALSDLILFTDKYRNSKYYMPAVSLILDTYTASERWKEANELAVRCLQGAAGESQEFKTGLMSVAEAAQFKMIEAEFNRKNYLEVLNSSKKFMKKFPQGKRYADCASLAANAAIALKDKSEALSLLSLAVRHSPASEGSDMMGAYYLTAASVGEEKFELIPAVQGYLKFLRLPESNQKLSEKEILDLKAKVLQLAWLSGSAELLRETLRNSTACVPTLAAECQVYSALLDWMELNVQENPSGVAEAQGIRSILSLKRQSPFVLEKRLELILHAVSGWEKISKEHKYVLLPFLTSSLLQQMEQIRLFIRGARITKLDPKMLKARVQWVSRFEAVLQKVGDLPWMNIRAAALSLWASIYLDLSEDILRIRPPAGATAEDLNEFRKVIAELVAPYREKLNQLTQQAQEVMSTNGVDPVTKGSAVLDDVMFIELLRSVKVAQTGSTNSPSKMQSSIMNAIGGAITAKNRQLLFFLISYGKEKSLFKAQDFPKLDALALKLVGAQAEALAELSSGISQFDSLGKVIADAILVCAFFNAKNRKKTEEYLKAFNSDLKTSNLPRYLYGSNAKTVLDAAAWIGIELPRSVQDELATLVHTRGNSVGH